jgi:hypothetical protein
MANGDWIETGQKAPPANELVLGLWMPPHAGGKCAWVIARWQSQKCNGRSSSAVETAGKITLFLREQSADGASCRGCPTVFR